MLGAKLGKVIGSRMAFQIGVILHGLAMVGMAISISAQMMIEMQVIAGLAAAILVPTLVVMIAHHYKAQQSQSLGLLAQLRLSQVYWLSSSSAFWHIAFWRYGFALIISLLYRFRTEL